MDLSFAVTPITGDPDLYVSSPNSTTYNPRPHNSTTADRIAQAIGADVIDYPNAALGTYYVGVGSITNSEFTLIAFLSPRNGNLTVDDAVVLVDGEPQTGFVTKGHYQYYALELVGHHDRLVVTVTKLFGDPDLYIINDGTLPTTRHFRWASNRLGLGGLGSLVEV